jgi:uncharacterized membrane protein YdjX (TVP38/TMEM64 family)
MKINKKFLILFLALFFISWIIISLYLYNIWFKIDDLINYIWNNILVVCLVFIFIFSIRIFLFVPSTIIIIWLWLLIDNVLLTFIISSIWIFIWLIQTYFIGYLLEENLEWWKIIKKIKPHLLKIKEKWFLYIFLWCLAPILPTDLICYSAWFTRYKLSKFLLAWMLWEIPLILLYSYLWWKADIFLQKINYILIWLLFWIIIYFVLKKIRKK